MPVSSRAASKPAEPAAGPIGRRFRRDRPSQRGAAQSTIPAEPAGRSPVTDESPAQATANQANLERAAADRAVAVDGLTKIYDRVRAVDGVSFDVRAGEIFGIIGSNGSGKTTTVECLQGLRRRDGGAVSVLGLDPGAQRDALRHRIGSQLQESALPERLKVWEALDLFAALSPRARDWRRLVEEWGLHEKRQAAFSDLSGGQRQRLFVALALVNDPEVVFLDEMTTGLDPSARHAAWDLVRQVRERGTTVVLVTHFMDEAEALCDRIAVFESGKIAAIDSPAALVARFADQSIVHFSHDGDDLPWLDGCPGVQSVARHGTRYTVTGEGPLLAYVGAALVTHGIAPLDLRGERATLEEAFLRITAKKAGAA
ncbi:MAG: ABC transporter ATP-binding protein [Dehalococcoidia bacterium]|nr:ABC transporter ATP-binding protein [Dehalococcoidia bacterium]